jgi:hypothetical protein
MRMSNIPGSLTIPAEEIKTPINVGVADFPEIEGYCSCFDSGDRGSGSDSSNTTCNTVTKLC